MLICCHSDLGDIIIYPQCFTCFHTAGLVAFIDTARQLKRERNANKCLKAAQQRSPLSQRGNLDSCSEVTSWRDYQYASRTNSLGGNLSPTQPSPNGTLSTLDPNSPGSNMGYNLNPAVYSNGINPNGLSLNGVNGSRLAPKRQLAPAPGGATSAGANDADTADDRLAVGTPFHRNGRGDTVVEVHDGVAERKPAIKGIDEVRGSLGRLS